MSKKVIFIGNRVNVFLEAYAEPTWGITKVFAVAESYLAKYLTSVKKPFTEFKFSDRKQVIDEIQSQDFDILVSNGCPFILPITELSHSGRLFLNTHPSLLPALKGPTPINGLFLFNHKYFGATTHYMSDDVDAGKIIAQVKHPLTDDLDLGLAYRLSFLLEGDAFRQAIMTLENSDYSFPGLDQVGEHSFYKRKVKDLAASSITQTATEIAIKVKAFGIGSLGVSISLASGEIIKALTADVITNKLVAEKYGSEPGDIILEYEGNTLIQCAEGILRVTK